ncbi:hypothetical protein AB0E21_05015 [Streptomyces sp. NPDC047967]|uniref:hypothetical protein n=1 Tax=Streptomyces sp. NPDC047967 TaxID=3154924 RepID=UPI003410FF7A
MPSLPMPNVPRELTEPTAADATETATRLTRALRGCGIFLERVRPDSTEGRPVVALHGNINVAAASRLAAKLESLSNQPGIPLESLRPPGTLPLEVSPHEVQVGDYLPLDEGCFGILNLRGAGVSGRILELVGRQPFVMTGTRVIFRPAKRFHGPIPS